ncbi:glycosyltransferase family 9 protein [Geodermatophilus sp. TF02-6]|uniref:glycosyltransferase family 9 protein n=1 Tax=Geodermatophilus sp. TF02-6 TaxID=2250575 RepID=UPI000DE9E578|nr:glycosyltransferase family 9 protein [Geodermatophilus sp. TF02-6]RBY78374.1 glycosyltransferase family 9 protein [Geodermatophilus sp. TF02-6]
MSRTVLVARLDSVGDVLVQGPMVRAVAAGADRVVFLAGPAGAEAARLLPGVDEVWTWACPWILGDPPPVDAGDLAALTGRVRALAPDEAVVSTSFHQSPLPLALLLRAAGVPRISAISVDHPGSLLDVRHRVGLDDDTDLPEPERALSLARAAGFDLPAGDDGRLAVRRPLPAPADVLSRFGDVQARGARAPGTGEDSSPEYVVLHPGASVPARAWPAHRCTEAVEALTDAGHRVLVTGGPGERELTAVVAGRRGVDLGGALSLAELAALLDGAAAVVVGNTGPAHLAAAVGTPVVSLFSPVVPAARWAPYGVPTVLLGDQHAPCRLTRARECPVPGHPCLSSVSAADVVAAVEKLGSR